MRVMLLAIMVSVFLGLGVFVFSNLKKVAIVPRASDNPTVILIGDLQKTKPSIEYSFVLNTKLELVPVTSNKEDLSRYENKKITVTGQFSGRTLYIDEVKEF